MTDEITTPQPSPYKDDDLVYVDPKKRTVVGRVEWAKNGNPKPMEMKESTEVNEEGDAKKKGFVRRGPPRKRYYPWGTYRTMKKLYRIEGREKDTEQYNTLDEAMAKSATEPFWD
jgi:hypothetical protein